MDYVELTQEIHKESNNQTFFVETDTHWFENLKFSNLTVVSGL